jgi:FkbM family methyltransferase
MTGQPLIAKNRFGSYSIPPDCVDRPAARKVLEGEVRELRTLEYIASVVGDGDIIHAGAFFGDMLPALSAAVGEGAIVWAFEPSAANFAHAQKTIELNGLKNVKLAHAALGDKNEQRALVTSLPDGAALGGASHVMRGVPDRFGTIEPINVVTIDHAISADRKVTVLHLDVEKYETEAVTGGLETIRRCRPLLILESAPPPLRAVLAQLGYVLADKIEHNKIFTPVRR